MCDATAEYLRNDMKSKDDDISLNVCGVSGARGSAGCGDGSNA